MNISGKNALNWRLDLLLPVGISYYTFQAIGYIIDVYRGTAAEKNFIKYALFVSFFPVITSGPIERSSNMLKQFNEIDNLIAFGKYTGLAFQVVDDILDITSTSEVLGKNVQKDIESNKATYPAVYSLEGAKQKADEYINKALYHLDIFGERADILRDIARFITERNS